MHDEWDSVPPPEEIPTQPDLPRTVARRCRHCGLVYGEHALTAAAQSSAKCRGIRKGFDTEEMPTQPDLPRTVARKCRHCGFVYGEHAQTAAPQSSAKCRGIRKGFDPEENGDGDPDR